MVCRDGLPLLRPSSVCRDLLHESANKRTPRFDVRFENLGQRWRSEHSLLTIDLLFGKKSPCRCLFGVNGFSSSVVPLISRRGSRRRSGVGRWKKIWYKESGLCADIGRNLPSTEFVSSLPVFRQTGQYRGQRSSKGTEEKRGLFRGYASGSIKTLASFQTKKELMSAACGGPYVQKNDRPMVNESRF